MSRKAVLLGATKGMGRALARRPPLPFAYPDALHGGLKESPPNQLDALNRGGPFRLQVLDELEGAFLLGCSGRNIGVPGFAPGVRQVLRTMVDRSANKRAIIANTRSRSGHGCDDSSVARPRRSMAVRATCT